MIQLLKQGKRILNVDESWLNDNHYHRRMWAPPGTPASSTSKQMSPRLSLIAALDSDGRVFYALTHAITDTGMMKTYLSCLCRQLDREIPNWKEDTVLLLDGAKYHTSEDCQQFLRRLGVQTIYSGPYSYCR